MTLRTTGEFRTLLSVLPSDVRVRARRSYRLFRSNPLHASLHFKQVHPSHPIFSARVGLAYRALGVKDGEVVVWFWIGSHAESDELLRRF